jgi:hypothetical protein
MKSENERRHVATWIWGKGKVWGTQRRALSIVADGDRLLNRAAINCRAISLTKLSQFPRRGADDHQQVFTQPIHEFRGINALIRDRTPMLLAPRPRLKESESKHQSAEVSRYWLSRATRADERSQSINRDNPCARGRQGSVSKVIASLSIALQSANKRSNRAEGALTSIRELYRAIVRARRGFSAWSESEGESGGEPDFGLNASSKTREKPRPRENAGGRFVNRWS